MRPRGLPEVERFAHGTRSRYVGGCRCDDCRSSNAAYYHVRKQRGLEAAAELEARASAPIAKPWRAPDGQVRTRVYKAACPGILDEPCPIGAHLRADSKGGICYACRYRLGFGGLVAAAAARKHLRYLSRAGVGYKSVAAASDVAASVIMKIRMGVRTKIRLTTERKILSVSAGARADASIVSSRAAWLMLDKLIARGWTKTELARRLGSKAREPAIQLGREGCHASTALRVRRLFNTIGDPPERGSRWRPRFCDCIAPAPNDRRCDTCGNVLRPIGMTRALVGGAAETTKPLSRAFGFDGGWSVERRSSRAARLREEKEIRQLARSRGAA